MNKKVDNVFVPKFIPNNLKWYEHEGLIHGTNKESAKIF